MVELAVSQEPPESAALRMKISVRVSRTLPEQTGSATSLPLTTCR